MEITEKDREMGADCSGSSKLVWEWDERGWFKVYYDRKMICPYVLCLNGQVHAMFSELDDAQTYVWECW